MARFRLLVVVCAATLSAVFGRPCPASAQLLVNGSFESPSVGLTGISVISSGFAGFFWQVDAGNIEIQGQQYPDLPGPAFDGTQFVDLNGTAPGALAQTFATTPGTPYTVSFAYANNYVWTNPASPALATVHVATTSGTDLIPPVTLSHGTSTAANLDWTVDTFSFTPTTTTTALRFISNSPATPLGGLLLDGASVTAVPEPNTIAALASLAASGLLARRRTTRANA